MEEIKNYQLSEKAFIELEEIAEHLFCTSVILDYFCKNQPEREDLYYITPIIKYLKQKADKINSFFINFGVDEED
ncbi:MAG: hypothetical protein R3Y28_06880 [Candidatus Gastranaerophilales bacterium]